MWPGWGLGMGQATPPGCDLNFLEAISKRMQVPSRLKVAGEDDASSSRKKPLEEVLSPAFQMYIPDRLLLAETNASAYRPLPEKPSLLLSDPPQESAHCPFLSPASRSDSQKRKHLVHPGRVRKETTWNENPSLAPSGWRHDWLEPSFPLVPSSQCPAFPSLEGRIYSLQNILRVLQFLGLQLFQLLWRPSGAQLSPHERGPAAESPLEELGAAEMLAMQRQLTKISGRLRRLEGEHVGWRQKELLVYSALLSVCLLDLWLWLRR